MGSIRNDRNKYIEVKKMKKESKVKFIQAGIIIFIVVIILLLVVQCSRYDTPEQRLNKTNQRWEDILHNKTCEEVYKMYKTEGSRGRCPDEIGACSVDMMKELFMYKECSKYSIMVER